LTPSGEAESGVTDRSILAKVRLVIFGSPAHALAKHGASPETLCRYDFFMSDAAGDYHQALRRYFEAAELPPPQTEVLGIRISNKNEGFIYVISPVPLTMGIQPLASEDSKVFRLTEDRRPN
jgi:DNA-binding transcriptional LysR family regulator